MPLHSAEVVGASAVYRWTEELAAAMQRKDKFGEPYSLAYEWGAASCKERQLLLPRMLASIGARTVDVREPGQKIYLNSTFEPWDYEQARVVDEVTRLLRDGENFQLRAPTQFGKTWCMMDVIARIGRKTIVVVPKSDLVRQWNKAASALVGVEPGLIKGDIMRVDSPIVLASIQSVCKLGRYPESLFQDFGLAIWDESHLASADEFSKSALVIPARLRMGMSATAGERVDGKDEVFEAHVGPVMVETEKVHMTPAVFRVRSPWTIPHKKNPDTGVWHPITHSPGKDAHVIRIMAYNKRRNSLIVRFVTQSRERGRQIIVFSALKKHLEILKDMLVLAGVSEQEIAYYVGGRSEAALETAKTKPIILSTYKMGEYGTSIPTADTLVLGTPRANVKQIVGRVLSWFPGKKTPAVLDIVDDSSSLYLNYWVARNKWYESIGAEIKG